MIYKSERKKRDGKRDFRGIFPIEGGSSLPLRQILQSKIWRDLTKNPKGFLVDPPYSNKYALRLHFTK